MNSDDVDEFCQLSSPSAYVSLRLAEQQSQDTSTTKDFAFALRTWQKTSTLAYENPSSGVMWMVEACAPFMPFME